MRTQRSKSEELTREDDDDAYEDVLILRVLLIETNDLLSLKGDVLILKLPINKFLNVVSLNESLITLKATVD